MTPDFRGVEVGVIALIGQAILGAVLPADDTRPKLGFILDDDKAAPQA